MTRTTAEKVIQLLLDAGAALNETVRIIQEEAQLELTEYCQRTGQTMAAIYLDLIKPIARVYPDLDPAREGS